MNRTKFFNLSFISILTLSLALSAGLIGIANAANDTLLIDVELPQMNVAEYHKPYVAIWLEDRNRNATQIALWYDVDMEDDEGKKWLKDIRQWWRRVGRKAEQPFDGLTSATKSEGKHSLEIDMNSEQLQALPIGEYQLLIEASREVGGKEVINIPLVLPLQSNEYPLQAHGSSELGAVQVSLN